MLMQSRFMYEKRTYYFEIGDDKEEYQGGCQDTMQKMGPLLLQYLVETSFLSDTIIQPPVSVLLLVVTSVVIF